MISCGKEFHLFTTLFPKKCFATAVLASVFQEDFIGVTSQAFSMGEFMEGRWSSLVFVIHKLKGLHHIHLTSFLHYSGEINFCGQSRRHLFRTSSWSISFFKIVFHTTNVYSSMGRMMALYKIEIFSWVKWLKHLLIIPIIQSLFTDHMWIEYKSSYFAGNVMYTVITILILLFLLLLLNRWSFNLF